MNKILYYMSLISEVIFLIMVCFLFPYLLQTGFAGILFLGTVIIYIVIRLFMILTKKKIMEKVNFYNFLTIMLTFYLGIIFTRIMLVQFHPSALYELSMDYCRNNFFLISLTMICIILNTIILLFIKDDK